MQPIYLHFLRARLKKLQSCLCEPASSVPECNQEQNPTLGTGNANHTPTRDPRQVCSRGVPSAFPPPLGAPAWKMRQQQSRENAQSVHGEGIAPCPSAVLLHIICSSRHSLRYSQALMLLLVTVGSQAALGS